MENLENITREQLLRELEKSNKRIAELEKSEVERKQAEKALKENEERYEGIIQSTASCIVVYKPVDNGKDFVFVDFNPMAEKVEQISKDKVIGRKVTEVFPGVVEFGLFKVFQNVLKTKTGKPEHFPVSIYKDDRIQGYRENYIYKLSSGEIVAVYQDLTKRKQAEEELRRINRALKMISECNQALIHAEDEEKLLNEISRIIVDSGGYRLAWIGYAEKDEQKTVRPVAQMGYEDEYLNKINITWTRNIFTDPNFAPWRAEATKRGYASSMALPLISGDQTFGALNIYAAEPEAFEEEEAKLLVKLADDLAYGVAVLRMRIEHKNAEEALKQSERKYRFLFENAIVGIGISDLYGKILTANDTMCKLIGYPPEELSKVRLAETFVNPENRLEISEKLKKDGKVENFEVQLYNKNKEIYWANLSIKPIRFENQDAILTTAIDITERKQAEEELAKYREHLEELVKERTAELEEKNIELKRYNKLFEGRELRIKELRDKVKELEGKKLSRK